MRQGLSSQYDHIASVAVGTKNNNVNSNSNCYRTGNVVVCNIRYDLTTNISLYTGLPTSVGTAWAKITNGNSAVGTIQMNANGKTLNYTNEVGSSNAAKTGQLVYITNDP